MMVKLKDGGIVDMESDKEYHSGCETCDYGSSYISCFNIELVKYNAEIRASKMYDKKYA